MTPEAHPTLIWKSRTSPSWTSWDTPDFPTNQQRERLNELNKMVRETPQFKQAEAVSKLIRLPTGDGMALAFFTSPEAALKCAIEISKAVGQALPPAEEK